MKTGRLTAALLTVLIAAFLVTTIPCRPSEAAYSTGFSTKDIQILTPAATGRSCDGLLNITGTSKLERVWFCLRGPNGELVTAFADVVDGQFSKDIWLRFGSGEYTVWAGNNSTSFDGSIRFTVINKDQDDLRYSLPSAYVDSDNRLVIELAAQITKGKETEMEKLQAIHDWVTSNIAYDYQAFQSGNFVMETASQTIQKKVGTCRNYSFVVAALARAAGMQSRIVTGNVTNYGSHAWNEVLADGRWVTVDATWDAGYIQNGAFVASPGTRYLDPDMATLAMTHQQLSSMLY